MLLKAVALGADVAATDVPVPNAELLPRGPLLQVGQLYVFDPPLNGDDARDGALLAQPGQLATEEFAVLEGIGVAVAALVGAVAAVLDGAGPQFVHVKESVRPECPPEKVRAVLALAEPFGPHVGQAAEDARAPDPKAPMDDNDIIFISLSRCHHWYRKRGGEIITEIGVFPIVSVVAINGVAQRLAERSLVKSQAMTQSTPVFRI